MKKLMGFKKRIFAPFRRKIFCIGHNKTGTTTIEKLLQEAGYYLPVQKQQEKKLTESIFNGDLPAIRRFCSFYSAFQDLPFSQSDFYVAADAYFPGSKFILTVRDADEWYYSLERFHLRVLFKQIGLADPKQLDGDMLRGKNLYLHTDYVFNVMKRTAATVSNEMALDYDWSRVYDRHTRVKEFEERNKRIIRYFQDRPNDLLVIDVSKEVDNSKVVEFLGLDETLIKPIPHLNSSEA